MKIVIDLFRFEGERHPELVGHAVHLAGRHDTDYGVRFGVHADGLSDDVSISTKAALPQPVGEDDDVVLAGLVLVQPEVAADHRRYTESGKVARGRLGAGNLLRTF